MKRRVFYSLINFFCVCSVMLHLGTETFAKSNPPTHRTIHYACISDAYSIDIALQEKDTSEERLNELFYNLNALFLAAGVIKKPFSPVQLHAFYHRGLGSSVDLDTEVLYPYIALGADFNADPIDELCNNIRSTTIKRFHQGYENDVNVKGYDTVIEFPSYTALLKNTKGARIYENTKEHVSQWFSGYPVVFMVFVNESGTYEVEIEYSKHSSQTSKSPVNVYLADTVSVDKKHVQFSAKVPGTAKHWETYKKLTLGKLHLEAGKKYYIMLADAEIQKNKKKNVMALHMLRLKMK